MVNLRNRGRPPGPDYRKIERILEALMRFPDGLWLRKLSHESRIPLSTVHYYIERVLNPFIESVGATDEDGHFFGVRVIKLKPGVLKKLNSGLTIRQLLKMNEIVHNIQ